MKSVANLLTLLLNQFKLLSFRLGKIPAFVYFSMYLLMIFIFSLIYYYNLNKNHLYLSTIQYETEIYKESTNKIEYDLGKEIIQIYEKIGATNQIVNGWQIVIENLAVADLDTEGLPSEFSFELGIPINNGTEGNWDSWTFLQAKITVYTEGRFISNGLVYLPIKIGEITTGSVEGIPTRIPAPSMLLNYEIFKQKQSVQVLPLTLRIYESIQQLGKNVKGFPTIIDGQYMRMLYFSTQIATTNGLGDIVPISPFARFIITLETIVSIILIALFLNSLAYDIGQTIKDSGRKKKKTNRVVSTTKKRN